MKFSLFVAIVILYSFVEASMKALYTADIVEGNCSASSTLSSLQISPNRLLPVLSETFQNITDMAKKSRVTSDTFVNIKTSKTNQPFFSNPDTTNAFFSTKFYTVSASTTTKPLQTSSGSERKTGQLQNNPCDHVQVCWHNVGPHWFY
jgi:hypothetical protein